MGPGTHFTQTRASRNLSLRQIAGITSEQAMRLLCMVRWGETEGKPVCPRCGCKQCYVLRYRPGFKCRDCKRQFSVTSGTIFHSANLTPAQTLFVVAKFAVRAKGTASVDMARECGHDPGTMFVLLHKLRQAMASEMAEHVLSGVVEIDGCYIGKYIRPANHAEYRIDRRRVSSRNKKSIGVARQRGGRSLVKVSKRETAFIPFVVGRVDHNAIVHADEAKGWDVLDQTFQLERIDHSECYSDGKACTNLAESFFSRVRRAEWGIYHHISSDEYAQLYAEEINWRENNSRLGDAERFIKLLRLALNHPVSRKMSGYWQRGAQP